MVRNSSFDPKKTFTSAKPSILLSGKLLFNSSNMSNNELVKLLPVFPHCWVMNSNQLALAGTLDGATGTVLIKGASACALCQFTDMRLMLSRCSFQECYIASSGSDRDSIYRQQSTISLPLRSSLHQLTLWKCIWFLICHPATFWCTDPQVA